MQQQQQQQFQFQFNHIFLLKNAMNKKQTNNNAHLKTNKTNSTNIFCLYVFYEVLLFSAPIKSSYARI